MRSSIAVLFAMLALASCSDDLVEGGLEAGVYQFEWQTAYSDHTPVGFLGLHQMEVAVGSPSDPTSFSISASRWRLGEETHEVNKLYLRTGVTIVDSQLWIIPVGIEGTDVLDYTVRLERAGDLLRCEATGWDSTDLEFHPSTTCSVAVE